MHGFAVLSLEFDVGKVSLANFIARRQPARSSGGGIWSQKLRREGDHGRKAQ
jgi:hypothetical protein